MRLIFTKNDTNDNGTVCLKAKSVDVFKDKLFRQQIAFEGSHIS